MLSNHLKQISRDLIVNVGMLQGELMHKFPEDAHEVAEVNRIDQALIILEECYDKLCQLESNTDITDGEFCLALVHGLQEASAYLPSGDCVYQRLTRGVRKLRKFLDELYSSASPQVTVQNFQPASLQ